MRDWDKVDWECAVGWREVSLPNKLTRTRSLSIVLHFCLPILHGYPMLVCKPSRPLFPWLLSSHAINIHALNTKDVASIPLETCWVSIACATHEIRPWFFLMNSNFSLHGNKNFRSPWMCWTFIFYPKTQHPSHLPFGTSWFIMGKDTKLLVRLVRQKERATSKSKYLKQSYEKLFLGFHSLSNNRSYWKYKFGYIILNDQRSNSTDCVFRQFKDTIINFFTAAPKDCTAERWILYCACPTLSLFHSTWASCFILFSLVLNDFLPVCGQWKTARYGLCKRASQLSLIVLPA